MAAHDSKTTNGGDANDNETMADYSESFISRCSTDDDDDDTDKICRNKDSKDDSPMEDDAHKSQNCPTQSIATEIVSSNIFSRRSSELWPNRSSQMYSDDFNTLASSRRSSVLQFSRHFSDGGATATRPNDVSYSDTFASSMTMSSEHLTGVDGTQMEQQSSSEDEESGSESEQENSPESTNDLSTSYREMHLAPKCVDKNSKEK